MTFIKAKGENTGGGVFTFWGETEEGSFICDTGSDEVTFYDADTFEHMQGMLHDENFDSYLWEQEHFKEKLPDEERQMFFLSLYDFLGENDLLNAMGN